MASVCHFRRFCRLPMKRFYSTIEKKTVLYDFHVSHGGRMVPFAGWMMPVQYNNSGIKESHLHCRSKASLFDVSHMLQANLSGPQVTKLLKALFVADVDALTQHHSVYTLLTNDNGGIIDDAILTCTGQDSYYLVSNASRADTVTTRLKQVHEEQQADANIDILMEYSLLALQGPAMASVLSQGVSHNLDGLSFMTSIMMEVFGIPQCRVTRCGYTGEDGVEIQVPSSRAVELADKLLQFDDVQLAGLGARDSLRMEAGLCLYGQEISEDTTPVEAGLAWCITKQRRKQSFPGHQKIIDQLKNGATKRKIGLKYEKGPPSRGGSEILDKDGNTIGVVTSGCPSPTLDCNIAMGYVPTSHAKLNNELQVSVRKKQFSASVCKLPFIPLNYHYKK
ncbi:aminomethyltransferase, mitochondrial-like [Dysidea avara]|uniref:aminomethyltransferase, mitochondrial-like n=1 Tax=Dysidea avara TaxID=196820 RepID=UPI00332F489D